jgi:hypothetical protein
MEPGAEVHPSEEHANRNSPAERNEWKNKGLTCTYVSKSIQERILVVWYALTTRKFPSTSDAARMMSTNGEYI